MVGPNRKALVKEYFCGVDNEDLALLLGILTESCIFSVETHRVRLIGHDQISSMFHRLWSNHKSVRHDQFFFVDDYKNDTMAVRFRVTNKLHNNKIIYKSNCNFFTFEGNKFSEVRVYMAGDNTLDNANKS